MALGRVQLYDPEYLHVLVRRAVGGVGQVLEGRSAAGTVTSAGATAGTGGMRAVVGGGDVGSARSGGGVAAHGS